MPGVPESPPSGRACHICAGTGLTAATSAPGTGLTPPTSAPGLGSPLPHPRPGLGSPLPHPHRDLPRLPSYSPYGEQIKSLKMTRCPSWRRRCALVLASYRCAAHVASRRCAPPPPPRRRRAGQRATGSSWRWCRNGVKEGKHRSFVFSAATRNEADAWITAISSEVPRECPTHARLASVREVPVCEYVPALAACYVPCGRGRAGP